MSFLHDLGSAGSSLYHQSKACVSNRRRTLSPPGVKLFRRQRLKELRSDLQLPAEGSGLALTSLVFDRDQPYHRLLPASDHDLFAPASLLNEPRKLGFGFVDGDGFHKTHVS